MKMIMTFLEYHIKEKSVKAYKNKTKNTKESKDKNKMRKRK
jgi:hypothetical protein